MYKSRVLACLLVFASISSFSLAQSAVLNLPRQSQHAVVEQRIGITDITINYHRPLANGRKIWGGLVPYGQVWRAGANENTTISFGDPVTIEGKPLDRGTYGLHMIPGENEWTVIFSKVSSAWGSFTYKESEDALRVTVKSQTTEPHDALTYDFDQLKTDSAVATMRWDKVAVPFTVAVNVNQIVQDSLHQQLRGLAQYTWEGWDDAATYLADNKVGLDDALKYEDESIKNEERFDNLLTKSRILEAMGRTDDAKVTLNKGLSMANAQQLYGYGRQLQRAKKQDEAFAIYRTGYKRYPNEWLSHAGMARIYSGQGDFENAQKELKLSLAGAPDQQKQPIQNMLKRLEKKDDINK
jgi:Protein of unknown function (DUF2911)